MIMNGNLQKRLTCLGDYFILKKTFEKMAEEYKISPEEVSHLIHHGSKHLGLCELPEDIEQAWEILKKWGTSPENRLEILAILSSNPDSSNVLDIISWFKRKNEIKENMETLQLLERFYRNKSQEKRIKMLRFWKEQPQLGQAGIAKLLGRSRKTIQWWWKSYQKGGLEALLNIK